MLPWRQSPVPIPFDAPGELRITATNTSGESSEPMRRTFQTAAEPVTAVTAADALASIRVQWTPTAATSYRVKVTNTSTKDTAWIELQHSDIYTDFFAGRSAARSAALFCERHRRNISGPLAHGVRNAHGH